jgi:hypothetical protein
MNPGRITTMLKERFDDIRDYMGGGLLSKLVLGGVAVYLIVSVVLGIIWSQEPPEFSVKVQAEKLAKLQGHKVVIGSTTTATLIKITETLLDKPGGYISNDRFPPGLWLDNIKNWEFGVLVQVRDLSRAFRKDLSRSQSQSVEDPDLTIAEPQFHFDNNSWMLPDTEGEYHRGIKALYRYLDRLSDPKKPDAQFYARSDNLRNWLSDVENRLGSLSRRLSESVGNVQLDMGAAGDTSAKQSTEPSLPSVKKTPWMKIDDVFYEARGTSWALIEILKAIEVDFHQVLVDKNALVSLQQIIIGLQPTQDYVWSPIMLNGSGFGFIANYSLTMSSYLSRASAQISDLRNLLQQG